MAWDSKRPIPWRRLGLYLAIYALAMAGFSGLTGQDVGQLAVGLLIGIPVAALFVVILAKFGYLLPILKSREEVAADRAARLAQRQASRGGATGATQHVPGPRERPAPTRRTSTGPSQHRRSNGRKR